jgi:uncharacterized protein
MGRVLVLILLVVLAVWLIRRALRPAAGKAAENKPPLEGDLVSCARCGLNLPRTEAREAAGVLFCSDEHARLGRSG